MLQVGYRWSSMPCKSLVFYPRGNGTDGTFKQRKHKNGLYNIWTIPQAGDRLDLKRTERGKSWDILNNLLKRSQVSELRKKHWGWMLEMIWKALEDKIDNML